MEAISPPSHQQHEACVTDLFPQLTGEIAELHLWESGIIAAYLTDRHAGEAPVLCEILSSPRYAVALYGPTKAGKTTLILKLLGVDESAIGRILRGNEDPEKTGTPTAIIYSRSPDDDAWYVTGDDLSRLRIDDDLGAKSWLDHVRKRMEGQAKPPFHSGRPLKIEIPRRHFRVPTRLEKQEIELIDLPGHSGGGTEEVRHAQTLYDTIAKNAALVLHVYPASNLTSAGALTQFKSGSVMLDEWWNFPEKSRLVLTRTVTAQSVRGELEKMIQEGASDDQLRDWLKKHVHAELNRSGVPLRESDHIFPLEYGASWEQCREANDGRGYHDRMETVFATDYTALTALILSSDKPRLLFDHVSPKSTELHYRRRLEELDQQLKMASERVEKARGDFLKAQSLMADLREDLAGWYEKIGHYRDDSGTIRYWNWDPAQEAFEMEGAKVPWSNAKHDAASKKSNKALTDHVDFWRNRATGEIKSRLEAFNQFAAKTIGFPDLWVNADKLINELNLYEKTWISLEQSRGCNPNDWDVIIFERPARKRKRDHAGECALGIVYNVAEAFNKETKRVLHSIAEHVERRIHEIQTWLIPEQERRTTAAKAQIVLFEGDKSQILGEIRGINDRILHLKQMEQDFHDFLKPRLDSRLRHYDEKMEAAQNTKNICEIFAIGAIRRHLQSKLLNNILAVKLI